MKSIVTLLVLVCAAVITACTSESVREPSSQSIDAQAKPTHYVITLHGVRGNLESYGEFHEFVSGVLEKIDPSMQVKTYNWTYPVGSKLEEKNKIWDPHFIGEDLNRTFFIGPNAKIPSLGPKDRVSIIAYSMGGMMTMTWYYDTMFNFLGPQKKYTAEEYKVLQGVLEKTDNVIGLGPVFWGSVLAEFGWGLLGNGDTSQIERSLPKFQAFCSLPDIKKITDSVDLVKYAKDLNSGAEKQLPLATKQVHSVTASLKSACSNVLQKGSITAGAVTAGLRASYKAIAYAVTQGGNMHPLEFDNMRPTSEVIHLMRLGRMNHLSNENLRNRYRTRFTSIVGVFPCLQKSDKGITCNGFTDPSYKALNDGFVNIFAGVKRLEADGPVEGPNAVADFLFYTEAQGSERNEIGMNQFVNTFDLEKKSLVNNQEIFVENMHATVAPALMGLGSVGAEAAKGMTDFSKGLGVDVVIMNKECAVAETCEHPNFKHVIQTLTKCEPGSKAICDQDLVNKYFKVTDASSRLNDSGLLRNELGTYLLNINVRVPKDFEMTTDELNHIKTNMDAPTMRQIKGDKYGENRFDKESDPFILQAGRPSQFMSSFASIKNYSDSKEVRIVIMGRAFAKPGQESKAAQVLNNGVPLEFTLKLPGLYPRKITAKIKPTYTTYIDMRMISDGSAKPEKKGWFSSWGF